MKKYNASIDLTKLVSGVIKTKKGGKAIVISIEENHLIIGEKGIYMPVNIIAKEEADDYGNHGFISQQVSAKVYKEATEEEKEKFKSLPILGNIRLYSSENQAVENAKETEETDDLPF